MRGICLVLLLLASAVGHAQTCTFPEATGRFAALLQSEGLEGGALLVGDRQGIVYENYLGTYTPATWVPVASATKLLSAVRLVQLADQGALGLDVPVSSYLPAFSGEKGTMTVRQMFSHTAGYGDDLLAPVVNNDSITLAQAVEQIACCRPLNAGYTVGGQFSYGGVSMHVAGRVAEVRGGGDWQARWISELGEPLGISSIDWQGLGPTLNYRIAGGARSTLRDYGRVLHLLANDGRSNNRRLLSLGGVRQFRQDNVGNLPVAYAPPNAVPPVRYGLGSWMIGERPPGEAPLIHSLGMFGFMPWVDLEKHRFGVFMIRGDAGVNDRAWPVYQQMLTDIGTAFDQGCSPVEWFDEIFGAGEFE
ncbi:serine hydrolase domain-containing protein [Tahibacter amnicola]|uniref:Beta-lactamase family protein n=1 Tax=Tahibacter amnicola TaxID=2976241 RepID=A0ABY6BMA7_9GAMM|nr:serine hydrolase domain-containing protein [Tahibacter amnicola]UXI68952.1 beta-lactamase family protein [Tahibacter amnicola]